jgi:predicted AlkP superfamily pyrophosphatase or phosphodiesterase
MKIIFLTISLLSFLVSVSAAVPLKNVLIISIDALHPSALGMVELPTLRRLMKDGHYSLKGRSTTPPLTLLSHIAMFTGLGPTESGKTDNQWHSNNHGIKIPTIFDDAKQHQYKTGYFYSKEKLGFLVNSAVDYEQWSRENTIDFALRFIKTPGKHFTFLHVSGLDYIGPRYGWLSPEYLEELIFY